MAKSVILPRESVTVSQLGTLKTYRSFYFTKHDRYILKLLWNKSQQIQDATNPRYFIYVQKACSSYASSKRHSQQIHAFPISPIPVEEEKNSRIKLKAANKSVSQNEEESPVTKCHSRRPKHF